MTIVQTYMATLIKSVAIILITGISFASCKKEKTSANKTIEGIWQGKWGDVGQTPVNFIKFEIKPGGEMKRLNEQGQVIANGTWILNGVHFECTYTHTSDGQVHKIGGLYTDFDGVITGTWGYSPSKSNGGTIDLDKQ
jgi:hypothetical protein